MTPTYPLKTLLLFVCFICSGIQLFSQTTTTCGFDSRHKQLLKSNSQYKQAIADMQQNISAGILSGKFSKINAPVYRIPVVVHVIHNGEAVGTGSNISDAQIQSAITSLTQYFRGTLGSSPDAELEFELASLSPTCATTNGIIRVNGSSVANYATQGLTTGANETAVKNLSRWSNTDYYNIWVVSEINDNNAGAGVQGFAYFPGASAALDGTVILYNAFGYDPTGAFGYNVKGSTNRNTVLTHELGHALGLYHTFEGDDSDNNNVPDMCPVNTSCLLDGDEVCDTDPHQRSPSNCPTGVNTCSVNPIDNIVHNYMDYSSQTCQNNFTTGQITRMRAIAESYRPALIRSIASSTTYPVTPYSGPIAASCTPTTSATGLSAHYAGIMDVTVNSRIFQSSSSRNDNGFVNGTTNCLNLIELVRGGTYNFSSTVLAANPEQFRAWIDYNNDGIFSDATELIHSNNAIPNTSYEVTSGTFIVPTTATVNTVLRMRVMDDLTTAFAPALTSCANPVYGQAEDYPVFLNALLPVVLNNFDGRLISNNVTLNWNVQSQDKSKGFEVERSYDGVNFKSIAFIGVDKLNYSGSYAFRDDEIAQENNYYRLKQIDIDNGFEYSRVVLVKSPRVFSATFKVLNNPFNDYIDVQFDNTKTGNAEIVLLDVTGKVVFKKLQQINSVSRVRIDINGVHIEKGIYLLQINSGKNSYLGKVLKR